MTANPLILYGIPNCETVKKARAWLTSQGLDYQFHDFKKQGVPPQRLDHWISRLGWTPLVNRKGTTWRKLDPSVQAGVVDEKSARALIKEAASVIKRPVVEWPDGGLTVGFDAAAWADRLVKK